MTWEQWKKGLEDRYGTDTWKNQMEEAFLNDKFILSYHKDFLTWAIRQKKRIRTFSPESTSNRIVEKIFFQNEWWYQGLSEKLDTRWYHLGQIYLCIPVSAKTIRLTETEVISITTGEGFLETSTEITKDAVGMSSTRVQPSTTEERLRACLTCVSTDPTHILKYCQGKGKSNNEINLTAEAVDQVSVMEFQ